MGIEDIATSTRGRPLNQRYSKEVLENYIADLRRLLELESQGKPRPSRPDLVNYFLEVWDSCWSDYFE